MFASHAPAYRHRGLGDHNPFAFLRGTQEFVTASIVKVDILSALNGWLPSGTTGLWEINSIGEVVHDRQRMLIAVLSEGNATEDSGISFVQTAAETAATAVASARG